MHDNIRRSGVKKVRKLVLRRPGLISKHQQGDVRFAFFGVADDQIVHVFTCLNKISNDFGRCFGMTEIQKLLAIIFVLLAAQGDFFWQAV